MKKHRREKGNTTKWKLDKPADWLLQHVNGKERDGALVPIRSYVRQIANTARLEKKKSLMDDFNAVVHMQAVNLVFGLRRDWNVEPVKLDYVFRAGRTRPMYLIKDSEDPQQYFWAAAIALGKAIHDFPDRLKICPYCDHLFWDKTRPANKRTCGIRLTCIREWAAERARESYYKHRNKNGG